MNTLQKFYTVKRNLLLLVLVLINSIAFNVIAQQPDIQLTIEVIDVSSPRSDDGAIQIEVQSSGSDFLYMLYDKEPWMGGEQLKAATGSGTNYSFTGLKKGQYYVCVQNNDKVTKCTTVSIKTNK